MQYNVFCPKVSEAMSTTLEKAWSGKELKHWAANCPLCLIVSMCPGKVFNSCQLALSQTVPRSGEGIYCGPDQQAPWTREKPQKPPSLPSPCPICFCHPHTPRAHREYSQLCTKKEHDSVKHLLQELKRNSQYNSTNKIIITSSDHRRETVMWMWPGSGTWLEDSPFLALFSVTNTAPLASQGWQKANLWC